MEDATTVKDEGLSDDGLGAVLRVLVHYAFLGSGLSFHETSAAIVIVTHKEDM